MTAPNDPPLSGEKGRAEPADLLPDPLIPQVGPKVWTPDVSQVGTGFHVAPTRGLMCVGNWALNPYHRKGFGNFCAQFWRTMSGAYHRREYPKTERGLRKAVAECEVFCEREEGEEKHQAALLATVLSGSTSQSPTSSSQIGSTDD